MTHVSYASHRAGRARRSFGRGRGSLAGAPVADCPFPRWLPSAPPAPAPSRRVAPSRGKLLYETDSNFLSMDGAAAGSGGRDYSPYSHGRHDADKGQLGASIQFDLVPKAKDGKASVPSRGTLCATNPSPTTMTMGAACLTTAESIGATGQMPLSCCGGAMQRPTRCGWTAVEPAPATSGTATCARRGTAISGTTGLSSGWPTPSHRTTAFALPASRPFSTAASRSSTAPAAAGWTTSARTAHAVQMGAKVSRILTEGGRGGMG
jgi:hypothetical protein